MRILGVDPSITCTGVSYPDGSTQAFKPRTTGDDRLEELADKVGWAALDCQLVVMEGLGGVYKGEAAKIIPMLHGALRLELKRRGVPYMVLMPSSLKKFATGNGSADKTAMALAALKRLGREYPTGDECDADWCRVAGRFAYGLAEWDLKGQPLQMPQDQLKALRWSLAKRKPIEWPRVGNYQPWPGVALRA